MILRLRLTPQLRKQCLRVPVLASEPPPGTCFLPSRGVTVSFNARRMAVIVVAAHFHGPEFPQRVFGE
ncbi:MAG TPA: hypothetical protein VNH19_24230, partial [Candidatus Limnocylindrales bacterium]|nr:hypothetical protein [Candidatus Limnocylindrales bacterium]